MNVKKKNVKKKVVYHRIALTLKKLEQKHTTNGKKIDVNEGKNLDVNTIHFVGDYVLF